MVVDNDPTNDTNACESVRFVEGNAIDPADPTRRPYVDVERGGTVGIVVNVACPPPASTTEPTRGS